MRVEETLKSLAQARLFRPKLSWYRAFSLRRATTRLSEYISKNGWLRFCISRPGETCLAWARFRAVLQNLDFDTFQYFVQLSLTQFMILSVQITQKHTSNHTSINSLSFQKVSHQQTQNQAFKLKFHNLAKTR